jgi:predicted glycosyltransferase
MNILVDIVHPADVLFFLHPIKQWRQAGHSICVASRQKDVTEGLLNAFGIEHRRISSAGGNLFSLGIELARRDLALLRLARRFKPDVMCGFGGVAISHVGKLIGIPSVSFYDTERAPLQHRLTLPFISHLHIPESYDGPVAVDRTSRFPGTKDFSYLHPENFTPDMAVAIRAGLAPAIPNYFVRLVGWQANHDVGLAGWSLDTLHRFVAHLGERGRVHISSELPLPATLHNYQYSGAVNEVHHLLAQCQCYIGESATMAGEAVLLGVPAVYATGDRRCYTDALAREKLLWKIPQVDYHSLCGAVTEIEAMDHSEWSRRLASYMQGKINLADYVFEAVIREGSADR